MNNFQSFLYGNTDKESFGAVDVRFIIPRETAVNIIAVVIFSAFAITLIKKLTG